LPATGAVEVTGPMGPGPSQASTSTCPRREASLEDSSLTGSLSASISRRHGCSISKAAEGVCGSSSAGAEIEEPASRCQSAVVQQRLHQRQQQQHHHQQQQQQQQQQQEQLSHQQHPTRGDEQEVRSRKHGLSHRGGNWRGNLESRREQRGKQLLIPYREGGLAGEGLAAPSLASERSVSQSGSQAARVPPQQRLLRGLRVRCAAAAGSFYHDGSISAARLYREQHGGRPYTRLVRLCDGAPIGQVVCSSAVGKCIHRAAAAGDPLAQQLLLTPLSCFTAVVSPSMTTCPSVVIGSDQARQPPPAVVASRNGHRLNAAGVTSGDWEVQAAAAAAAAAAAVLGTWESVDAEESSGLAADGRISRGRTAVDMDLGVIPRGQVFTTAWVCNWSGGAAAREALRGPLRG
ncbi:hypothetical protein Vretifemale_11262, partial [Volvox reticuliferus]